MAKLVMDTVYCAEVLAVSEGEAKIYMEKLQQMIKFLEAPVEIHSLNDFEKTPTHNKSFEEIRKVLDTFDLKELGISYDPNIIKRFAENEVNCSYYQNLVKVEALQKIKGQRNFKGLPEELQKKLHQLDFDQFMSFSEEGEHKSKVDTIKRALENTRNETYKTLPKKISETISRGGKQFDQYLSSIIKKDEVIRLSVNLHHTDMSLKLPICLVYRSEGTPWHHTPIVKEIGSTSVQITMGTKLEFGVKTYEEIPSGISYPVRWMQ